MQAGVLSERMKRSSWHVAQRLSATYLLAVNFHKDSLVPGAQRRLDLRSTASVDNGPWLVDGGERVVRPAPMDLHRVPSNIVVVAGRHDTHVSADTDWTLAAGEARRLRIGFPAILGCDEGRQRIVGR